MVMFFALRLTPVAGFVAVYKQPADAGSSCTDNLPANARSAAHGELLQCEWNYSREFELDRCHNGQFRGGCKQDCISNLPANANRARHGKRLRCEYGFWPVLKGDWCMDGAFLDGCRTWDYTYDWDSCNDALCTDYSAAMLKSSKNECVAMEPGSCESEQQCELPTGGSGCRVAGDQSQLNIQEVVPANYEGNTINVLQLKSYAGSRSNMLFTDSKYHFVEGDLVKYKITFRPSDWDEVAKYSVIVSQFKFTGSAPFLHLRVSNTGDRKVYLEPRRGAEWVGKKLEHPRLAELGIADGWTVVKLKVKMAIDGFVRATFNDRTVFEWRGNMIGESEQGRLGYVAFGMNTGIRANRALQIKKVQLVKN